MKIMSNAPEKLKNHRISEYLHASMFSGDTDFFYVTCYDHDHTLGFPLDMHKHSFYEINIITSGSGYHYWENRRFEALTGDVYAIPPNVMHGYYTDDPETFHIYHIVISSLFFDRYKEELHAMHGYSTLFEIEPIIRTNFSKQLFLHLTDTQLDKYRPVFGEMIELDKNRSAGNNIKLIIKTLDIISSFSSLIVEHHDTAIKSQSNSHSVDSINIIKAIEYILRCYDEKITVDDLAKIANMSRSTFIRQFKTLNRCTPNKYLTKVRIDKAAEMLRNSDKSISRISQDCGFFDSSHFCKNFTLLKGVSPLEFRHSEQH